MPPKPPTRKNPSVLEYLHNPAAYPHVTMNTQPELADLYRVGPPTDGGVTPVLPIPNSPLPSVDDLPRGPGGVVPRPAPRMSLVQALAPPGAVEAPQSVQPWGMLPSQPLLNDRGAVIGRFDSGIAPPSAALPRLPRRNDEADLRQAFSGLGQRIATARAERERLEQGWPHRLFGLLFGR